jgi:uncharacterized protein YkwD
LRRTLAAGLLLLLAGCATAPPVPKPAPPPPDPATLMGALEDRIALLIEEERERAEPAAKPLAVDPELTEIARERARDMAAKNYFAHAAPNGDTSATLLAAKDPRFQGLLGENLSAAHYVKQTGVDVNAFARDFVDRWMKSPQHRDNIIMRDYDLAGIGAAVNGDTVYVTALFATDLGLGPHEEKKAPQGANSNN